MIELKPLNELNANMLNDIITGYVSEAKYIVEWVESDVQTSFTLELVRLEKPYVKQYDPVDDETLRHYRSILPQGFSLGAYESDQLVGIAIAEAQGWNATLRIWDFHVAANYRGKGIGTMLMTTLAEKSRAAHLRVMVCETQTTNVSAIGFYRTLGFRLEGIDLSLYTNADWPDGEIAVFMKRRLS